MNCRYLVSITAALALLAAACSSGSSYSSGYGSSSYSGGYEAGTAGTPSASATPGTSSSTGGSESLSNDIHGLMHAEKQDERIKRAEKTEALLGPAGFKLMPIDTPAKHKVIEGLSPLSFNRLAHHGKIHYWFADPYYCNCVYVGDELAYLRYKQAKQERKQEKVEAAYLVDTENQVDLPMDSEWDPVSAFGMP